MFYALFQLKLDIAFFDIFSICLAVDRYFVDINWLEGYANVNLTKKNTVIALLWDINSMFRNYVCISTKYKIDTWHRVIYNTSSVKCNTEYSFSNLFENYIDFRVVFIPKMFIQRIIYYV